MTSSLRWKCVGGVARCARLALIATTLASQQVFATEFAVTDLGTLGGGPHRLLPVSASPRRHRAKREISANRVQGAESEHDI